MAQPKKWMRDTQHWRSPAENEQVQAVAEAGVDHNQQRRGHAVDGPEHGDQERAQVIASVCELPAAAHDGGQQQGQRQAVDPDVPQDGRLQLALACRADDASSLHRYAHGHSVASSSCVC